MRRLTVSFMAVLFVVVGCSARHGANVADLEEKPDVFCQVTKKPDPLLMGTWECSFTQKGEEYPSYAKYTLVEYKGKYAIHFYRAWKQGGRKKRTGWRDWIINGNQITGLPVKFGVRIFTQGQDVYFIMRDMNAPVRMSRVAN